MSNHLYTWIHNNASSDFPLLDSTALRLDDLDGKPILSRAGSGVGHWSEIVQTSTHISMVPRTCAPKKSTMDQRAN